MRKKHRWQKSMSMLSAAFLLTSRAVFGGDLVLTWEFNHTYTPAPHSFLVTYSHSADPPGTLQQFRLPNTEGSCAGITHEGLTVDAVCGRPPGCLPPGSATFWVQAEWGGTISTKSNLASCTIVATCQYQCTPLVVPPEIQKIAETPPQDPQSLKAALGAILPPSPPSLPPSSTPSGGSLVPNIPIIAVPPAVPT